jgi:hypothetical protein
VVPGAFGPDHVNVAGEGLEAVDLFTHEAVSEQPSTRVALEGYGYRWFRVRPTGDLAIP